LDAVTIYENKLNSCAPTLPYSLPVIALDNALRTLSPSKRSSWLYLFDLFDSDLIVWLRRYFGLHQNRENASPIKLCSPSSARVAFHPQPGIIKKSDFQTGQSYRDIEPISLPS
jgi:hypothetical protein